MKMHMVSALNSALKNSMKENDKVMVLGEDVGVDGGVFRVSDGLINEFGEERVVDTPLAEAGIVGGSVGLALNGMVPICEIQFSGFSYQAFHHIKQHLARFRQRSHGTMTLPLVLRTPCAGGIRALEHHSESPESFFIHCQGIKVVMPSGPYDAKGLLATAVNDPNPVLFFEHKALYRSIRQEVPIDYFTLPFGKASLLREGENVTIISYGAAVHWALETLDNNNDISADLIDLRSLQPLDTEAILNSVKKTGRAIILQEDSLFGGIASDISSMIMEQCFEYLDAPVKRVASIDTPIPFINQLEEQYLPKNRFESELKSLLAY